MGKIKGTRKQRTTAVRFRRFWPVPVPVSKGPSPVGRGANGDERTASRQCRNVCICPQRIIPNKHITCTLLCTELPLALLANHDGSTAPVVCAGHGLWCVAPSLSPWLSAGGATSDQYEWSPGRCCRTALSHRGRPSASEMCLVIWAGGPWGGVVYTVHLQWPVVASGTPTARAKHRTMEAQQRGWRNGQVRLASRHVRKTGLTTLSGRRG